MCVKSYKGMILRYSAFFLFLIPLCSYAEEGEFYFDFSPELQSLQEGGYAFDNSKKEGMTVLA